MVWGICPIKIWPKAVKMFPPQGSTILINSPPPPFSHFSLSAMFYTVQLQSIFILRYAVHLDHFCAALYSTAIVQLCLTLCSASSPFLRCLIQYSYSPTSSYVMQCIDSPILRCVIQYSYSPTLSCVMQCIQSISVLRYTGQLQSNFILRYALYVVHFCAACYTVQLQSNFVLRYAVHLVHFCDV